MGARLYVYVSGGEKGALGLNGAAAGNAVEGLGDRELLVLVGEWPEERSLAVDFGDESGEEEDAYACEDALAADLELLAAVLLPTKLLTSGGNAGDSSCDMEGPVNGLTMVVLETCLPAGGEKDV